MVVDGNIGDIVGMLLCSISSSWDGAVRALRAQ
jgi:hypothetical protein